MVRCIVIVLMSLLSAVTIPAAPAAAQQSVLVWRQRQSSLEKPKSTAPVRDTCSGDVCSVSSPLGSAEPVELPSGHYYPETFEPGCLDGVVRIDTSWNGNSDNVGVNLIDSGKRVGGRAAPSGANEIVLEQPFASGNQLKALVYNQGNRTIDVHHFGRTVGCNVRVRNLGIDMEFNAKRDGVYGIKVLANFVIDSQLGADTQIVAYFKDAAGNPLRDTDGTYRTSAGNVSASTGFKPGHHSARYDRLSIFIPYDQLHLPFDRHHDLRVNVALFDKATGTPLAGSDYLDFWIA
jgi:hypothetical protein